ncbi:MAG: hypothetical protein KDA84_21245, partial [Planctomycetaceae bacterium]|nr:hypothetical protein [Planctomycetaceae bacterium]
MLKRQFGKGWANPIRHLVKDWQFHRGFVEGITIRAADFLDHAAELFQAAPICHVRLLDPETQLSAIAASPWLDRISSLDLRHTVADWGTMADLIYSPSVIQLKELNLRGTGMCNTQGMRMLADSEFLRNLRTLDLSQYGHPQWEGGGATERAGSQGIHALDGSPHLNSLRNLKLGGYGRAGSSMIVALSESSLLGQLQSLDISHNQSFIYHQENHHLDIVLDHLLRSPQVQNLRHLALVRIHAGSSANAFVESPYLRNLQSLAIVGTWLDTHGQQTITRVLGESPNLNNLVSLSLAGCTINDSAYRDLFASDQFHNLKELNLSETHISNESLAELADSSLMENLRSLKLQGSDGGYQKSSLTGEGLRAFVKKKTARHLEVLDLGNQPIGEEL